MARGAFTRWLYRGQRQSRQAKALNWLSAAIGFLGLAPDYLVTLQVAGRKTGRIASFPLVMVVLDGQRYLVSMLGDRVPWVRNLQAAHGRAVLYHGRREAVRLVEVPVALRVPILKAYLRRAPGARPHIAVDKDAPLAEFERIAPSLPVYRVIARDASADA
jgi:hypothetical protein